MTAATSIDDSNGESMNVVAGALSTVVFLIVIVLLSAGMCIYQQSYKGQGRSDSTRRLFRTEGGDPEQGFFTRSFYSKTEVEVEAEKRVKELIGKQKQQMEEVAVSAKPVVKGFKSPPLDGSLKIELDEDVLNKLISKQMNGGMPSTEDDVVAMTPLTSTVATAASPGRVASPPPRVGASATSGSPPSFDAKADAKGQQNQHQKGYSQRRQAQESLEREHAEKLAREEEERKAKMREELEEARRKAIADEEARKKKEEREKRELVERQQRDEENRNRQMEREAIRRATLLQQELNMDMPRATLRPQRPKTNAFNLNDALADLDADIEDMLSFESTVV